MTEFEVKTVDGKTILDITEVQHVFVTEDETCAEITLVKNDLAKLERAIAKAREKQEERR